MVATEYTKRGHRLELNDGWVFRCVGRAVSQSNNGPQKGEGHVLAELLVWSPCTVGQVIATVRAWLHVYEDGELLEQVEGLVGEAFGGALHVPSRLRRRHRRKASTSHGHEHEGETRSQAGHGFDQVGRQPVALLRDVEGLAAAR